MRRLNMISKNRYSDVQSASFSANAGSASSDGSGGDVDPAFLRVTLKNIVRATRSGVLRIYKQKRNIA